MKPVRTKQKTIFSQDQQKLDQLVEESSRILYKISTVFPFDLFPDEVVIDENKVNIIIRNFFSSELIESVLIRDISQIYIQTTPFFASMRIATFKANSKPYNFSFLKINEAIKARRIIEGLRVVTKEKIDLARFPLEELTQKVENIGKTLE